MKAWPRELRGAATHTDPEARKSLDIFSALC
jgi:hypothetical protein